MKIAIIAHSFYPIAEPFAGGLEMITYQIVKELVRHHHRVDLYAHADSCPTLPLVPMPTEEEVLGRFDVEEIAYSGMSPTEFAQTAIYHGVMAKVLEGNYDIVHNHSLHHVPILVGNALGRRFITSLHTPAFIQLKLGFLSLPEIRQTVTTVSDRQQRLFDGIVAVDRTVYNGIDLSRWSPQYAPRGDHFFWMGRMCKEKAPHHAIEACKLAGKRLLLAGPISNREYFEEYVEPHLDHPGIVYLGHLTHREIMPYLRNAVAYLFTSVWEEPYGLTLAEALACATPVIAYAVGAAPEIVSADVGILVPKGDVESMATAMGMATKIDRRACRERAHAFCSSGAMVDRYLSLYRELTDVADAPTNKPSPCQPSLTTPIPTAAVIAATPISSAH